jgi:hypothetical protein
MIRVFAMQQSASAQAPLLIVENAHAMTPIELDLLCDFAEMTVHGKSALRIVLVSDRPLRPMMRAPAMQSMSQRVTGKFLLQPLTQEETACYVYRKLATGGCTSPRALVPPVVCDRLHMASGGWPGMIDRLAMAALANAERIPLRSDDIPRQSTTKREAARRVASHPHLIITRRGKTHERVSLNRPRLLIGRNELCDLRIHGDWISRYHAVLLRKGGTTIIADLKSRNGIYVNGERVSKQVLVCNDIISMGDHRLKFIDPSARRRTSLQGAGWDDTAMMKSITDLRNVMAKRLRMKIAS